MSPPSFRVLSWRRHSGGGRWGEVLPWPPPNVWSHWGAPPQTPPLPSGQAFLRAICTDLRIQVESKDFSEFRQKKSCDFFFQIVWAWQVPNYTSPRAPSSYNLKEKKPESKTAVHLQETWSLCCRFCFHHQNLGVENPHCVQRASRVFPQALQFSTSFYC